MIYLTFITGESKTGEEGVGLTHWSATSTNRSNNLGDISGVGDDPLSAVMELAMTLAVIVNRPGRV